MSKKSPLNEHEGVDLGECASDSLQHHCSPTDAMARPPAERLHSPDEVAQPLDADVKAKLMEGVAALSEEDLVSALWGAPVILEYHGDHLGAAIVREATARIAKRPAVANVDDTWDEEEEQHIGILHKLVASTK